MSGEAVRREAVARFGGFTWRGPDSETPTRRLKPHQETRLGGVKDGYAELVQNTHPMYSTYDGLTFTGRGPDSKA